MAITTRQGLIDYCLRRLGAPVTEINVDDEQISDRIDDAIEFCIIAALGFAFIENIMYFFYIWSYQGFESLFLSFIFRSIFSTFAHIFFSGIYGYYYGIAKFAPQIYQKEAQENKHKIIGKLHQILHLKGSTIFHEEKMMEGLIFAMICHAIFNSLLEFGVISFIVPLIGSLLFLVIHLFNRKEYIFLPLK